MLFEPTGVHYVLCSIICSCGVPIFTAGLWQTARDPVCLWNVLIAFALSTTVLK